MKSTNHQFSHQRLTESHNLLLNEWNIIALDINLMSCNFHGFQGNSPVSFLVGWKKQFRIPVSDVEARKNCHFYSLCTDSTEHELANDGQWECNKLWRFKCGLGCVCVFVLCRQRNLTAKLIDLFFATATLEHSIWSLVFFFFIFVKWSYSFYTLLQILFHAHWNRAQREQWTNRSRFNSFQFILSKNLSPFRMASLWFSILSYSSSCHRSFAAEWNRHSIIIFMFHILRVFWWQTWTNELGFSLLVDGFSLIFY